MVLSSWGKQMRLFPLVNISHSGERMWNKGLGYVNKDAFCIKYLNSSYLWIGIGMVQICNYSSLIFAGNITVLLIVSMTTDYWEHRAFNRTMINQTLFHANFTQIKLPPDTKSYFIIWYKKSLLKAPVNQYTVETLYQPPMLARNYFQINENISSGNGQKHSANIHSTLVAGMVVLFEQYGNLFRDCDALEGKSMFERTSSLSLITTKAFILSCTSICLECSSEWFPSVEIVLIQCTYYPNNQWSLLLDGTQHNNLRTHQPFRNKSHTW